MIGYSPKLRVLAKKIDNLLAEADVAALYVLCDETHVEFNTKVDTSWSLLRFIRKSKAMHLKMYHSKQPQLDQTGGMVAAFRDLSAQFFSQYDAIWSKVQQHAKVTHAPGPINNDDREDT